MTIDVKGFQWQWQFHYRDDDVTVTGLPDTVPTMVLPVDRTVRLVLTSPDVIHSFYVPEVPVQARRDPGRRRTGSTSTCETSGHVHGPLRRVLRPRPRQDDASTVKAVSMAEYRDWVAEQQRVTTHRRPSRPSARAPRREPAPAADAGILRWLTTTDHKGSGSATS